MTPSAMAADKFHNIMKEGYSFKGKTALIGAAMNGEKVIKDCPVSLPLSTMNRHGLIAGATGTGKTRTLQVLAENLSEAGVSVLLMDMKGDLTGFCYEGEEKDFIRERHENIAIPFEGKAFPVEILSLSDSPGVKLRATVSEMGPDLMARIMDLNETQAGMLSVVFKYCDDQGLLLLDLADLKAVLNFLQEEGKADAEKNYGKFSAATLGTMFRKVVTLEQKGLEKFFGEPSFDVNDLIAEDNDDLGFISILRVAEIQDKPELFSTFMLSLLAEIFANFPEAGDLKQPKLVIFIDEAHLIFNGAHETLMKHLENIVKLIRSKGVGLVFCTQNPDDVPAPILAQLGFKIQHALRAFTARDRKAIKMMAQNFPESEFYDNEELLTGMGIGEAMLTGLDEKGRPTPLVRTMLRAPRSSMEAVSEKDLKDITADSPLVKKYAEAEDKESASEKLRKRTEEAVEEPAEEETAPSKKEGRSKVEKALNSPLAKQIGRTLTRELTRGVLGAFGIGGRKR